MRVAYITAGAAGMYCGTCMHDNTLAAALLEMGHDVALTPTYTPLRTDEDRVSIDRVFFGAVNVYLQQRSAFFRHLPRLLDRILDRPRFLDWVARYDHGVDPGELGAMTVSMLRGEHGFQKKELEKLVDWLQASLRPELVHLSFTLFLGFARRIKEELGVPIVCSLQGEDHYLEQLPEPYRREALEAIADRAADVDVFLAPTHDYADFMADSFGLPRSRIDVVRLGVRVEDFLPVPDRQPGTPVTLGYLARQSPEKGLHVLLEAFRALCEDASLGKLRLRIAGYQPHGDRAYVDRLRRRVEEWGLDDVVEWLGEVDRQGKVDFLRSLDLFSVPAVFREPKGLYVLEALATGVPVVVPRHGAFPELIERTGGGLLVDPDSADALAGGLRQLIRTPHQRRRLGEQGRDAVRTHHTARRMAEDNLAVYRRLTGEEQPANVASGGSRGGG